MAALPIKFQEKFNLTSAGILPASIGFNSCTLESDHFVCVRQTAEGSTSPEVIIVNLKNNNNVTRRPIKADSAIMHWSKEIIALKASGKTLQIFDLAAKAKLKSATMNEDVVFWKWFSETTLGLVTDTAVYHWNIFDPAQAAPAKVFDRNNNLAGCQIINYRVADDEKWSVVVGISQQQGRVVGAMQLYSKDRGISQAIEGHAAAFGTLRMEDAPTDTKLFTFANRTATGAKLHIVEVDHTAPNPVFQKKAVDIYFPAEATNDFPVAMQVSKKYKVIYLVTKYGFIHLYDLETGTTIFMNRISSDTIFTTASDEEGTGVVGVNRKGQVLFVSIDDATIIPYLLQSSENAELAYKLASRASLPGADQLYQQRFDQLLAIGDYQQAAKTAANSPQGFLRTPQTIEKFKAIPQQGGQLSVILQYFGMLLDKGKLNQHETLELARPVLQQDRKHLLEKWMKEGKLGCSEQLGDLVRTKDAALAQLIYQEAGASQKVIAAMAESGNFDAILPYSKSVGYTPDYNALVQHVVRMNPDKGAEFATALAKEDSNLLDIERTVDIFQSQGMVQQATAFLLDVLGGNLPEQGHLQTRLLEMNLMNAPQVADAILTNQMFSHYDRPRIAQLCENAGLFALALDHYENPADIKRCVVQSDKINEEFLSAYFGKLTVELALECLDEMLKVNIRQNLQVVINIAKKYSDLFGPNRIIDLLEKYRTAEGLYFYLGGIVNISEDKDVTFKYIEAATKMGQLQEVERVCRESNFYDPEKVKNFLKEQRLTEQLPLIIVCDRFNFVHDLVLYLYKNQAFKSIEVYVQRVNPARTPGVIAGLLDVDCDESIIKNLLSSVSPQSIPIDELVQEVESRNRLKLLLPFLEATLAAGNQQQAVYNALAKIYIDSNSNPEAFLKSNDQYDTLTVGKYCEKRDPNLAFIAYSKGQNDLELISITNENAMFKAQARYLLDRADPEIWEYVLSENNIHRRSLVDQIISTAVPESQDPEKVSIAVKAFIDADMPVELIELLEKIILEPSTFSDNANLQNLLMLTACKSDRGRVANYIQQLNAYSPEDIAQQCVEVGMFEEAFLIHKKAGDHLSAANVLVDHVVSIDRAQEYADQVDLPEVWSKVGKAQLDGLRVSDSIESYIKAQDPSNNLEVIETATHAGKDEDLIKYLRMSRKTLREPAIDTALAFAFARTNQLPELEEFLRSANVANIEESGDKAYAEGYHEAAKLFFTSISNWAKLATTLVHLEDYQGAVECARKANSVKVWKQVNETCVAKKEFKLAQICGLNLIVHAEELADLVKQYERNGYFDELIQLLEAGLGLGTQAGRKELKAAMLAHFGLDLHLLRCSSGTHHTFIKAIEERHNHTRRRNEDHTRTRGNHTAAMSSAHEYALWLCWGLITLCTPALQNPVHKMVITSEQVMQAAMSAVVFAPGLLDVLQGSVPPTLAFFKGLSADIRGNYGVYVQVMEKTGCRPRIFIGSGTGRHGVASRFLHYEKGSDRLPVYVQSSFQEGFSITHSGLLCWSPIPDPEARFALRSLFLILECVLSLACWTMHSRTKTYGMPNFVSWPLTDFEYDGLCHHSCISEHVWGEDEGLTEEQIAAKLVVAEERRKEQDKAARQKYYAKRNATDAEYWRKRRNTQKRASVNKILDAKTHWCEPCQQPFQSKGALAIHLTREVHKRGVRLAKQRGMMSKWTSSN